MTGSLLARLVAARAPTGGWGWRGGQQANTECTALAVLAMLANGTAAVGGSGHVTEGLSWLRSRQHTDGSWPLSDQVQASSWTTAVAVLALAASGVDAARAARGASWLLDQESRRAPWLHRMLSRLSTREPVVDQDAGLVGWSWTAETAAWVEPTAWSLLAVKTVRQHLQRSRVAERVESAHRMLDDRMCRGGGWNYGNKRIGGQDLDPYPDTTALALMALQDRPSAGVTGTSIARLHEMIRASGTSLVLALSVLALQLHGQDVAQLRQDLAARLVSVNASPDVRTLALALLALDEHRLPFQVPIDG